MCTSTTSHGHGYGDSMLHTERVSHLLKFRITTTTAFQISLYGVKFRFCQSQDSSFTEWTMDWEVCLCLFLIILKSPYVPTEECVVLWFNCDIPLLDLCLILFKQSAKGCWWFSSVKNPRSKFGFLRSYLDLWLKKLLAINLDLLSMIACDDEMTNVDLTLNVVFLFSCLCF